MRPLAVKGLIVLLPVIALCQEGEGPPDSSARQAARMLWSANLQDSLVSLSGALSRHPGWTSYSLSGEFLLTLPERNPFYFLSLLPGIAQGPEGLHIRGSRSSSTHYFVDGTSVTNPMTGQPMAELLPRAIAAVEVHTGPFDVRLPSASGGVIEAAMRRGGEEFEVSAEYRTDDFVKPGNTFVGTTPQGLKEVTLTLGGPIAGGVHYFLAGQYSYLRNDQRVFLEPFSFQGLTEDGFYGGTSNTGRLLVSGNPSEDGTITFKRNYLYKNWTGQNALNAHFDVDLLTLAELPLKISLGAIFGHTRFPGGGPFPGSGGDWPGSLAGYYRSEDREMMNERKTEWISGNLSLSLGPGANLDVTVTSKRLRAEAYDPAFGRTHFDDYLEYSDSLAYARRGLSTDEWRDRYTGPVPQSTIYAFPLLHPQAPNGFYEKSEEKGLSFRGRLSAMVANAWTLEIGGGVDSWTMRRYRFGNIPGLLSSMDPNRDGDFADSPSFPSEYAKRVWYIQRGRIDSYGYTHLGEVTGGYALSGVDANLDPPYRPMFADAYTALTFAEGDIQGSIGIRYEYSAPKFKDWIARRNLPLDSGPWYRDIPFDGGELIGDEAAIGESDAFSYILPRAHLRVPLAGRGDIYFAFGSYATLPPLEHLYLSTREFSAASGDGPYTLTGRAVAFEVKPERSTHYELGTRMAVAPRVIVRGSFYYKSLWNQLQIGQYLGILGEPVFPSYQSTGNGSARGIELGLDIQRREGLAISGTYTYTAASGLSSDPLTTLPLVTDYPPEGVAFDNPHPYDYERQHKCTGIVDYWTGGEAGSILGDLRLTAILTYSSGHPYTRERPSRPGWGSATPWTIGVWSAVDPRMFSPQEPLNSSRTASVMNVDVRMAKGFRLGAMRGEVFLVILNVMNSKNVLNVYPTTGSASTDGWLGSDRVPPYLDVPLYEEFYRAINNQNGWAYSNATGRSLYGLPRQLCLGLNVRFATGD